MKRGLRSIYLAHPWVRRILELGLGATKGIDAAPAIASWPLAPFTQRGPALDLAAPNWHVCWRRLTPNRRQGAFLVSR